MENWPMVHRNCPHKDTLTLRETLLEFTMNFLLDQPDRIMPYAREYFIELCDRKTEIVYDLVEECEEEEEEKSVSFDLPDDLPDTYRVKVKSHTVYSEAYNPEKDDDDDEEDVVFGKTDEQREMLRMVVSKCLLFRALDPDQINKVIDVMFPKEVQAGDLIIKQFDDGDNFYVIEYGLYDVLIAQDKDSEPVHVFTYPNSGTFGELALMYNMPRAATIRAASEGKLWAMDRKTFRKIVLKSAFKKRKMYEELIAKVGILQQLTQYERMNLADALIPKTFEDETVIIQQGDSADGMYFIEKGEVICYISGEDIGVNVEVCRLYEGAYFGELALLTHKTRAATVVASGQVKVAFLDVDAFERVLGPCVEIMERHIGSYYNLVTRLRECSLARIEKQSSAKIE